MKNLIKLLAVLMALCLVLCACGAGQTNKDNDDKADKTDSSTNDTSASVQTTAGPSDEELIVGKWKGTIDCGDYFGEVMGASMGQEVAAFFDFSGVGFDILLTFEDNGNFTLAIDQESVDAFAKDIVDELMAGLHSYMEVALAAQLGGKTLDEYLAANNMDFAQLMAASGLNVETLAQQMSSSFENAGNEGKYAFEDGLLSLDGDHHSYELSADSLTIEIPEDVTYELVEVLFPMELERIG